MGNHEDMLIDYIGYTKKINEWDIFGNETIASYRCHTEDFYSDLEWIKKLPLYHEDKHFIYVHAGIEPNIPMNKQKRNTLLWVREPFIYCDKSCSKTVIFGHTPTQFLNNDNMPIKTPSGNIDIDTGCVYGGALTALILENGNIKNFYQVKREVCKYEE